MTNRHERRRQAAEKNEAWALSRDLVNLCERSKAHTDAIIEALSVVLGMIIANVAENKTEALKDADAAMQTIKAAIATYASRDLPN
jgi:hypothetical protein